MIVAGDVLHTAERGVADGACRPESAKTFHRARQGGVSSVDHR